MIVTCSACRIRYNDQSVSECPMCKYGKEKSRFNTSTFKCVRCGDTRKSGAGTGLCHKCYRYDYEHKPERVEYQRKKHTERYKKKISTIVS